MYEVVRTLRGVSRDQGRLQAAYHWLTDQQLRSALAYAEAFPAEIDAALSADEEWTAERVWQTYPFMRPDTARE